MHPAPRSSVAMMMTIVMTTNLDQLAGHLVEAFEETGVQNRLRVVFQKL